MSAGELLRATVYHTPANPFHDVHALHCHTDGGLLVRAGRIVMTGDYHAVRAAAPDATTVDWRGGFLLPGLIDSHVHFPQLRIIGSLGRSLLDWLEHVALPEESRMADFAYAQDTARGFVHALAAHGTTTALVFGAHFAPATAALFEQAAASGLRIISGLVLSDRLLLPELHQAAADAYRDSTALIERFHQQGRLLYAVTPRFALSTSEAMLEVCQTLCDEHDGLRVQTHLNENVEEVAEVQRLFPGAGDYFAVYEHYGLTGPGAVMAHSVLTTDSELERLAAGRTSVAHCPASNAALGSGIFPFNRHLAAGVHCALGTDVGGGIGFGLLKEALQGYLMQRVTTGGVALDPARLLFLATRAGATALGLDEELGDFQPGKAADFLYLRPPPRSTLAAVLERAESPERALAALITLAGAESVQEVRVAGEIVFRRDEDHRRNRLQRSSDRPELM